MKQRKRPAEAEYDRFLYSDYPYSETHPDRLAALGMLHGMRTAPPGRCRVLELGCGLGGNLIAMAEAYPESSFLGIDLSPRQIAAGRESVAALGLSNIELVAQDILDYEGGKARFDYILCHGIYSWVSEAVQQRILDIAGRHLAPQGIAYVSYNTLPGWHMRGMVRQMLLDHVGTGGPPAERVARARELLGFLGHVQAVHSTAHAFLESEVKLLETLDDEYLYYEHLVEHNHPVYFRDFAAAAGRAGLRYISDAHFMNAFPGRLGPEALAACAGGDIIETEQRLDFLDVRFFRRSLLCRKRVRLDRDFTPARLRPFHFTTKLVPVSDEPDVRSEEPEDFRTAGNRGISAHEPLLKAALCLLYEQRPRGLSFDELCVAAWELTRGRRPRQPPREAIEAVGTDLIRLLNLGFVELGLGTTAISVIPGPRPRATALVRRQAAAGRPGCTSLRHESIAVDDMDRALLRRLDGTLTGDEIFASLAADLEAGEVKLEMDGEAITDREQLWEIVMRKLGHLGRCGFLLE